MLSPGDLLGEGLELQGEVVRRVPITPLTSSSAESEQYQTDAHTSAKAVASDEPAKIFEVVRRLGTGSYAVVYLVREVLHLVASHPPSLRADVDDGRDLDMSLDGHLFDDCDGDDNGAGGDTGRGFKSYIADGNEEHDGNVYGREFAVKLLSKVNLDDEALAAQIFEVRHDFLFC